MDSKPPDGKDGVSDRFLCSHDSIQKGRYLKRKGSVEGGPMKIALRHGVAIEAEGHRRTQAAPITRLEIIVALVPMH